MKFKTGDKVIVIAGKNKDKESIVMNVFANENKLILEGVNIVKKHQKASGKGEGEIIEQPTKIDASNVAILDPKTKKASRISYIFNKKGKKIRISKKSGEEIK